MEALTEMEKAVLARLAANPFASQQEVAEALGIPRPTAAMHIAQLTRKGYLLGRAYVLSRTDRLVCIGGASIDTQLITGSEVQFGTSNPVSTVHNFGGVARNVAENAGRLKVDVGLISWVGDDENGRSLITHLKTIGVDTNMVSVRPDFRTATYTSVMQDHQSLVGFADMEIFDTLNAESLDRLAQHFVAATWVFADCNLPSTVLAALIQRKKGSRFSLAIDAVSSAKAVRLPESFEDVDALFLREDEARAYLEQDIGPAEAAAELAARGAAQVAIISKDFSVTINVNGSGSTIAAPRFEMVDPGGAFDALVGATLAQLITGSNFEAAVRHGVIGAAVTSEVPSRVHPLLSMQSLEEGHHRFTEGV